MRAACHPWPKPTDQAAAVAFIVEDQPEPAEGGVIHRFQIEPLRGFPATVASRAKLNQGTQGCQ